MCELIHTFNEKLPNSTSFNILFLVSDKLTYQQLALGLVVNLYPQETGLPHLSVNISFKFRAGW